MASIELPARDQIEQKYKWNDTSVFATADMWAAELNGLIKEINSLQKLKGRLAGNAKNLADILNAIDIYRQRVEKVIMYAYMSESVDTTNQAAAARSGQAGSLIGQVMGALSFVEPELLAIGRDKLTRWQKEEPRLQVYDHYFNDLFRRQAHVRSPEVEEVMGLAAEAFGSTTATFSKLVDSDFQFAPVLSSNGQILPIGQGTIDDLLHNPDRNTRRSAWYSYHDEYLKYKNTLAANLATSLKQNILSMRVRRFPTSLEMALFENNIPTPVFHNLLQTFRNNRGVWQRYWNVRRRALGLEKLETYDIWAPLTDQVPEVTYEQAVEWIATSLEPLGKPYADTIRRGCLQERWVDVFPNQGKSGGAFSYGAPGTYPFILMSYSNDALSLGTLAHELGHSLHSWLTWQTQPPVYTDYSLFAAEVASNFNQAMMRAYLLGRNDIDRHLKIAVLEEAMSNFHRYFLEMPTLAMFEWEMHKRVEQGAGLTADSMIDYLADLFAETYGTEAAVDRARDGIRWATFSHLYADYYVYQYATGISGANALARRVLTGDPAAAEAYLGFLKAGGSQYPLDALRAAGVDLSSPEPVEAAFEVLSAMIDLLDKLLNE